MPWTLPTRWGRSLRVDLRPGLQGAEWDELMDAILPELPYVDRVLFLVPELTDTQEQLLAALVHVVTGKGVHVERRLVSSPSGSE